MKTQKQHQLLALFAGALITVSLSAKNWEKSYEFNFPTDSGSALNIAVRDADVEIMGDAALSETTIVVTHVFSGGSESDAEAYFKSEAIVAIKEGAGISVENVVKHFNRRNGFFNGRRHTQLLITCPYVIDTTARTSDGDLTLINVKGEIHLRSSDGDLDIRKIEGNTIVTTSDGDVLIEKMDGSLAARTSDGSIEISKLTGSFDVQTSDGDIQIDLDNDPTGDCSMKTSDGDISFSVGHAKSLLIIARVSDGSIRNQLQDSTTLSVNRRSQTIKVGEGKVKIQAKTSDGSITIRS